MSLVEVMVALGLGAYFLVSVLNQISDTLLLDIGLSPLLVKLVPRWSFFAPYPPRADTHLVRREFVDGRLGAWKIVASSRQQPLLSVFHNPHALWNKSLTDLENILALQAHSLKTPEHLPLIQLSGAYLATLTLVERSLDRRDCEWFQFAFVDAHGVLGADEVSLRFVSRRHKAAHA